MKIAGIAITAAATAVLLAGCTGSDSDTPSATPSPTSTVVAGGETSTPVPTVGNLDDRLCAAAQESIDTSASLVDRTDDLTEMLQDPTFLTSDDATELNAWGNDTLGLANQTLEFYTIGVEETEGDAVNGAFVSMQGFVSAYTVTLAEQAAAAESPASFAAGIQETFSDPAVQEAVSAAPSASAEIRDYLVERCGITG